MAFDARAAKQLQAGQHIIVDDAPGLRLVAAATRKTWTYRYKSPLDGRMRQIAIGQWPAVGYPAAMGAWSALRARRDAGEDPARDKRQASTLSKRQVDAVRRTGRADGVFTVRVLLNDYLVGHIRPNRKPKGVAEVESLFGNMTALEEVAAMSVTRAQCFDVLEAVAKRGPVQAANLRRELAAAWNYALDSGRLPQDVPNWWPQLMRGKLKSKGKKIDGKHQGRQLRCLSDAEVRALLDYLPNFSRLNQDILELYLWTGCRGAEIVAMEGCEISEEADGWWWTVPKRKLKMARNDTTTDLRVPLVGRALEVVRRRRAMFQQGHMFPSRSGDVPHVQQKVVQVAVFNCRPGGSAQGRKSRPSVLAIPLWSAHDLRRTVRTKLAALGCVYEVAEAVIGHFPADADGTYNRHQYDVERRHWLEIISEFGKFEVIGRNNDYKSWRECLFRGLGRWKGFRR